MPPADNVATLPIHSQDSSQSNPIPVVNHPEPSVESDTVHSINIDKKGATSEDHHDTTDIPIDSIVQT